MIEPTSARGTCLVGLAATSLCLLSCAHAPIDRDESLGKPMKVASVLEVPVRGFPVDVTTDAGRYSGELLAVEAYSLYVRTASGETIAIARGDVRRMSVEVRSSASGGVGGLTTIGTLSTISHGMLLVFSAPIWLITGISTAVAESSGNDADASDHTLLNYLRTYARYPQGMPRKAAATPPPASVPSQVEVVQPTPLPTVPAQNPPSTPPKTPEPTVPAPAAPETVSAPGVQSPNGSR